MGWITLLTLVGNWSSFFFLSVIYQIFIPITSFFFKIFLIWTIFKVFIEFVTILLLFYVLIFWPRGMWDLSSPTRDRTPTPCTGRQSLNHWTAREVPATGVLYLCSSRLTSWGFPGGAVVGSRPANAGDTGSSPGLGRSHMPQSNWAREPQLLSLRVWSLCSATREAALVRGPRTAMKSGPRLLQLEKALAQKRRPNTAINK